MAVENYETCLLDVMDRLWFHDFNLFQEAPHPPQSLINSSSESSTDSLNVFESFAYTSPNNSHASSIQEDDDEEEEISSAAPDAITYPQDDESKNNEKPEEKTPTRLNTSKGYKIRSHSLSSSTQKRSKLYLQYTPETMLLHKTISSKSLWELEAEEVKGFMDLGFTFNKQHFDKRIITVIPGLQRLDQDIDLTKNTFSDDNEIVAETKCDKLEENEEDQEAKVEEHNTIMRPYLSEAWLIKKPDSPLLNLRVPRASAAADMKKHLKYWARTVASVIHQES